MTRVIHTVSQRRRVLLDGTVEVWPHVVIEVPATDLTWLANREWIGLEVVSESYLRGAVR